MGIGKRSRRGAEAETEKEGNKQNKNEFLAVALAAGRIFIDPFQLYPLAYIGLAT